jgi:hypothetical protein
MEVGGSLLGLDDVLGLAGVRRPSGYLTLRTLTHVTITRARANGARHIMFGTLLTAMPWSKVSRTLEPPTMSLDR